MQLLDTICCNVLTVGYMLLICLGASAGFCRFTEALRLTLAYVNPILFCEWGSQPPPGKWSRRSKPVCWLGPKEQFIILIARDTSKVAQWRLRRAAEKVRSGQLRQSECVSALPPPVFLSRAPIFFAKKDPIQQRSSGKTRLRVPEFLHV